MKKLYARLGWFVLLSILFLNVWLVVSGRTWVYKALRYNYVGIDDHTIFSQRTISKGKAQPWSPAKNYNQIEPVATLKSELDAMQSVAFLVIHRDSILYEAYWDGYSDSSWTNSFSMSKSVVGALAGVALQKGLIRSVDQRVADFIPEYASDSKGKITIRQLLTMSAALSWDEAYTSLFSITTEAYYGRDLNGLMDRLEVVGEPGQEFLYQGGATQLLSMVISRAAGMDLSSFCSQSLWKPLGAEHDAGWSIDRDQGIEKASCCIYSNARDFARIGSLYLHMGNWKGVQLIDTAFILESVKPAPLRYKGEPNTEYGFQWWISQVDGLSVYYCRGILGQYIAVVPEKELVVVRLGRLREQQEDGTLLDFPVYLRGAAAMASKNNFN